MIVNPRDSGVPLSGHKEPMMMQQQATAELFHPERFYLRTADWLHGNAPTNDSGSANWPHEGTIRPIMTSASGGGAWVTGGS